MTDISADRHRQQAHCWGQTTVLGSLVCQTCINPRYTEATSSSAGTALVDSEKGQGWLVQLLLSHIDRFHVCRVDSWCV